MRKGIMAMESLDEVIVDAPEADMVDFAEAPEADMIEMNEAAGEIQSIDEEITEASDTAETLDKMEEAIGESVEEGGMSEPAAEAVRIAVEHLTSRLGFPKSVKVFPAMEGFGDKATRVHSTKIAMEQIAGIAKKIWAAIVATYQKAVAWIKKFFAHLMDASVKLKDRADALVKAAAAKRGSEVKNTTLSTGGAFGGFAKTLHIGGVVPSDAEFVSEFKKYSEATTALAAAQSRLSLNGQKAIADMLTTASSGEVAKTDAKVVEVVGIFEKESVGETSTNKDFQADGMITKEQKLHFGDKSFFSTVVASATTKDSHVSKIKFQLGTTTGAKEVDKLTKEVSILATTQVAEIAKLVSDHMAGYANFKAEVAAIEKAEKDITAAATKLAKENTSAKDEAKSTTKLCANIARAYISSITSGASALRSYDISVSKATLDYCAASLKGRDAKEEAPAA